ncbi:MAG: hypothetical protein ABSB19_04215 [Methylomonas sp.]
MIKEQCPHLFAESVVFLSLDSFKRQLDIIAALEHVIAMPAYQTRVLADAPEIARFQPKASGVFLGYDFHQSGEGPKLIEINTNAGGALINAKLIRSQNPCCESAGEQQPGIIPNLPLAREFEQGFMEMFLQEWRQERGARHLNSIAIVDEVPENQYLLPEFLLFKQLFTQHGIECVICDPSALIYRSDGLWYNNLKIDLIYNRLTDFYLMDIKLEPILKAYLNNRVVLTPHPHNHALYANKRNLAIFGDENILQSLRVDADKCRIIKQGVAHTIKVLAADAEYLWKNRKQLFFKPAMGYGGKAAYRGDKLTRSVFNEIIHNDYVAQALVTPTRRHLEINHEDVDLKLDFRHYVYQGKTQLICARLYQGQTTNFRTPGGGFAQVLVVS